VRPTNPGFDTTYSALQDAVFFGNNALKSSICSDSRNLYLRQLCSSAPLSAIGCAMQNAIMDIRGMSIPTQVFELIVEGVSIIVAAFQALWARTNKGAQNQRGNADIFAFVTPPKKQIVALSFGVISRYLGRSRSQVSHISKIGDLIKVLVSKHGLPFFHTATWHANNPAVKYGTL
jgi:hypothetical protein